MFFSDLIIFRYLPKVSARGKMMGGGNNNSMVPAGVPELWDEIQVRIPRRDDQVINSIHIIII